MQLRAHHYTVAEYLALEKRGITKHEYVDGEIHAISGASRRHNLLAGNLFAHAWQAAAALDNCQVFGSDMKVRIAARNSFYYPDVSASCDPEDRSDQYLTLPCFIIEVASPSTASVDRREKRLSYATLKSLHQYVIVDQDCMRVDVYPGAGSPWVSRLLDAPEDVLELSCLRLRLTLREIYDGVELPVPGVREAETSYGSAV